MRRELVLCQVGRGWFVFNSEDQKGKLVHWQAAGKTHAEQFAKRLNDEQRMFVYRCIAEYLLPMDIQRMVKENYGVEVTTATIWAVSRAQKAKPHIEKFREEYMQKIKSVPIANKRIRLDDLEKTRVKLAEMIESNPLKTKSDKAEFLMCTRRLNETVCVAREEMERKPLMVQQLSFSDYSSLTDEELQQRKRDIIEKEIRQGRTGGVGEVGAGVQGEDTGESAEIPVAAPEKLRRE